MLINVVNKNGYKIIDVKEKRIDASNVYSFRDIVLEATKKTDTIIIDFSTVEFVDSSMLSTLVYLFKIMQKENKKLYIVGLSKKIWNLFDITGLTSIFKIFNNINECVEQV